VVAPLEIYHDIYTKAVLAVDDWITVKKRSKENMKKPPQAAPSHNNICEEV